MPVIVRMATRCSAEFGQKRSFSCSLRTEGKQANPDLHIPPAYFDCRSEYDLYPVSGHEIETLWPQDVSTTIGLEGSVAHSWSEAVYTATSVKPSRVMMKASDDAGIIADTQGARGGAELLRCRHGKTQSAVAVARITREIGKPGGRESSRPPFAGG